MTYLWDENVFDCPARSAILKSAAKLAEPDAVGIIPLKAFNKNYWKNACSLPGTEFVLDPLGAGSDDIHPMPLIEIAPNKFINIATS